MMTSTNKKKKKLSGVVVPALTPLTAENKLDEQAVENVPPFYRTSCSPVYSWNDR
jgi:hypothetical protein